MRRDQKREIFFVEIQNLQKPRLSIDDNIHRKVAVESFNSAHARSQIGAHDKRVGGIVHWVVKKLLCSGGRHGTVESVVDANVLKKSQRKLSHQCSVIGLAKKT